jgi:hypothetical protein
VRVPVAISSKETEVDAHHFPGGDAFGREIDHLEAGLYSNKSHMQQTQAEF